MSFPFTLMRFVASSTDPEDMSGAATFKVPAVDGNEPRTFEMHLPDFKSAQDLSAFIQHAYEVGKAWGYAECEKKVRDALL